MGKKIIGSYDIDISSVLKKLSTIEEHMKGGAIENFIPKTVFQDFDELQKRIEKLQKTPITPESGSAEIAKFLKEWDKVSAEISVIDSKLDKIDLSDKSIKENVKEIQDLVKQYKEATKAKEDYAKKIVDEEKGVKKAPTNGPYRDKIVKARNKMAEAATKGAEGQSTIKAEASSMREVINRRINEVEGWAPEKQGNRIEELKQALNLINSMEKSALEYSRRMELLKTQQDQINQELAEQVDYYRNGLTNCVTKYHQELSQAGREVKDMSEAMRQLEDASKVREERQSQVDSLTSRVKDLFSIGTILNTVRRVIHGAIQDFQELDKQFNEIAIVSDYSTQEMWKSFSSVNRVAQEFGVETKNVLEVQNLYYHQGKKMSEVNKLTAQTLTLAKITGMDYADATSKLTAVLNAYSIAAEDAVRVTDTIAAMDTNAAISSEELMTALTKTASIAANAGMSLESTEVFLTKMIETTREAPENLGTALKTIIARFGEVKQEIDGEIIEPADINRVDTALKSVGISLLDTAGQIRDLDGVFMELSSKWDGLDRNTQRYIATIAAGSRQQSRFIAMMEDYDRTLELVEISQDSAGLGAKQLAKSQESIESSVNRLKSSWQAFYSKLVNAGAIKGIIDVGNTFLDMLNALPAPLALVAGALAVWGVKVLVVDKGMKKLGAAIGEGIAGVKIFGKETEELINTMSKEQLQYIATAKGVDEYTKSLAKAKLAQEAMDNTNPTVPTTPTSPDKDFNKKWTEAIKKRGYRNKKDAIKNGEVRDATEWFAKLNPKGNFGKGRNEMLEKLLGKEGMENYLLGGKGVKGVKGVKGLKGLKAGKTITGLKAAGTTLTSSLASAAGSAGALLSVLWPILVAVVAIGTALLVWKKNFKASLDDSKQVEKLTKAQEEYNKQLKAYNDLKKQAKKYQTFIDESTGKIKTGLSEEERAEEQEIAKALVEEYPRLLERIDEEGNYHLKNAEAIQKEIAAKEKLLNQSADTYTKARLKAVKAGVYTDTNTQAGQAIKNIQDYSATFGTEKLNKNKDLQEIAKKIDAGTRGFNKSGFYDIVEAYAKGTKFSFDQKDFSDLFAGNITLESTWQKLLDQVETMEVVKEDGSIDEASLRTALVNSGAYANEETIDNVVETFMALNEEFGGMYGQLLEGAAKENAEILVENAKIELNKVDFQADVGDTLKTALSEAAVSKAKRDYEKVHGEGSWYDLKDEEEDDEVEKVLKNWNHFLVSFTEDQINDMTTLLNEDEVGSILLKDLGQVQLNTKAETTEQMKETLVNLYKYVGDETTKNLSTDLIQSGNDAIIETLYTSILEEQKRLLADKSKVDSFFSTYFGNETDPSGSASRKVAEGLDLDLTQITALADKVKGLKKESQASYAQEMLATLQAYQADGASIEQVKELFTVLLKQDLSSDTGIMAAQKALYKFGYTAEEVMNMSVSAMGGINNISLSPFEESIKQAEAEIESMTKGLEAMTALMKGTASLSQLQSYMDLMGETWVLENGAETAVDMMKDLSNSISATGDGFKLAASSATEYGSTLVALSKQAIITQASIAMANMNNNKLSAELRLEAAKTLVVWKQMYARVDAMEKKAHLEGLIESLEKAKEAADEFLEGLKGLMEWLRQFDRFASLDRLIKDFQTEFSKYEFEIDFSTNVDTIIESTKKSFENANKQLAANQAGLNAAKDEEAMWKDAIQKRNSEYVSFSENGTAIVNAEKIRDLQEQIANASEEERPVLQAKYDEIMNNVEAYEKARDKVDDYSKAVQENLKVIEDLMKKTYENITTVQEKLIELRMKKEDEEIKKVKEKYDEIKEEDEKYLDHIRDMIDKERQIRDREEAQESVKQKEKKLALMKMDTSGVYARDIQSLEKELEKDYQNLEDEAVDRALEQMEEEYEKRAEIMDKEVEYMEKTLEYKRETMEEYNAWVTELFQQGSDAILAYLKENDEEYYTGTAEQQALWEMEWKENVALADASNQLLKDSFIQNIFDTLETCKDQAGSFEEAVEQYSTTAQAANKETGKTVSDLVTGYSGLAESAGDVVGVMTNLAAAYSSAAKAALELKAAQEALKKVTGKELTDDDIPEYEGDPNTKDKYDATKYTWESRGQWKDHYEKGVGKDYVGQWDEELEITDIAPLGKYVQLNGTHWVHTNSVLFDGEGEETLYSYAESLYKEYGYKNGVPQYADVYEFMGQFPGFLDLAKNYKYKVSEDASVFGKKYVSAYATGGLADFTGPAWLDGTKSKPEMVLNPQQTQAFISLVDVLDLLVSGNLRTNSEIYRTPKEVQKQGDIIYNLQVQVDQMASDYDAEQLIKKIEEKLLKASRYRNVTTLTKKLQGI